MLQITSQNLIRAALQCATQLQVAVNISIVDGGANQVAFQRMDNAPLGSIDVAHKKARSAVFFGAPTDALGQLVSEQQLHGFAETNNGLILFAGGEPIFKVGHQPNSEQQTLIGGIGISGGSAMQDKEIALFAIKHYQTTQTSNNYQPEEQL